MGIECEMTNAREAPTLLLEGGGWLTKATGCHARDMNDLTGPHWSSEVGEADWIAERLTSFGEHVLTSVVPGGFEAYARVLHPAEAPHSGPGRLVRWREVANWSGIPLGPDSQFHSIALPPTRPTADAPWSGQGPRTGSLFPADAEALAAILQGWATTPDHCWFCLWAGYGWSHARLATSTDDPGSLMPDPIPESAREGLQVHLPARDYLLYTGPVEAVTATVPLANSEQVANLWWPSDRAWCVASEIDLAWTYVGGPVAMIDRLLTDLGIEAVAADASDHLTRVEPWVDHLVQVAVNELWAIGGTFITTSRGTVNAVLKKPGRRRRGLLATTSKGDNGVHGSRSHYLGPDDEQSLRETVEMYLTSDVIALVGG